MKIRNGFVTNSSSSSFILSSKKKAPEEYSKRLIELTKENLFDFYKEEYKWHDCYMSEDLQEALNLTEDEKVLVILNEQGVLDEYLIAKKRLENMPEDEYLYYLYEDRDWLYGQEKLTEFIRESLILDRKTDL